MSRAKTQEHETPIEKTGYEIGVKMRAYQQWAEAMFAPSFLGQAIFATVEDFHQIIKSGITPQEYSLLITALAKGLTVVDPEAEVSRLAAEKRKKEAASDVDCRPGHRRRTQKPRKKAH